MHDICNIAIFASGGGSNAEAIIRYFENSTSARVKLIVTNTAGAGVLKRAADHKIDGFVHGRLDTENGHLLNVLQKHNIHFIVLAGYLKKVGSDLIEAYPNRIVNIHPALLPKFGGKGMYGMNVHRAVVASGETESGPTIHYVNEHYDEGTVIAQFKCKINHTDSPEEVQKKVLLLEHEHYPQVIEQVIKRSI